MSSHYPYRSLLVFTIPYCDCMFISLDPSPPVVNCLRTGSTSYSSLHLQHQRLECRSHMIHICEEPTDFYTFHRKRQSAGKSGQPRWLLPSGRAGGGVQNLFLLLNKELSMNREDGMAPLPSLQAPFRSEGSLCPCLTRVFLSFERRPFLRQIFKLKSSRTKAACQLGPSTLVPLPLQPGCHYCLMGEVCEGFRCNIWPGPLSAGEIETRDFPI